MSRRLAKSSRSQPRRRWWQRRKTRDRLWWGGFGLIALVVVAGVAWLRITAPEGTPAGTAGQQVQAFQLPDVVSGQDFSLEDYLGKKDIVLVSYMGFF